MILGTFRYARPKSVEEAVDMLLAEATTAPLAGGTELLPRLKLGMSKPSCLVDLTSIPELSKLSETPSGWRVGAGVTVASLAADATTRRCFPALARAASGLASPQLRQRGTVGGNLCQQPRCIYFNQSGDWRRDLPPCYRLGGKECLQSRHSPECMALFYSDLAPVLVALEAETVVAGPEGERRLPLCEFYRGAGELALSQGEVLVAVEIPWCCGKGQVYLREALRSSFDFPLVGVACILAGERVGDTVVLRRVGLCLGAVAPLPVTVPEAEALLGQEFGPGDLPRLRALAGEVAAAAARQVKPLAEHLCPPWYKREVARALAEEALVQAWEALGQAG